MTKSVDFYVVVLSVLAVLGLIAVTAAIFAFVMAFRANPVEMGWVMLVGAAFTVATTIVYRILRWKGV